jgi:hypothetical protein
MKAPAGSPLWLTLGVTLSAASLMQACSSATLAGSPPVVAQCETPTGGDRLGPALVGQAYGMAMTPLPLNSVQFGSDAASRSMAVQNLYAARTPTNTVEVSARFVSCLDKPAMVLVRASFLRANSAPAEPPSAWKSVYLEPRATAVYSELSTSIDAAHYLIEVMR